MVVAKSLLTKMLIIALGKSWIVKYFCEIQPQRYFDFVLIFDVFPTITFDKSLEMNKQVFVSLIEMSSAMDSSLLVASCTMPFILIV